MPLITQFDTPASIKDFDDNSEFYKQWHNFIKGSIRKETAGPKGGHFYNPAEVDVDIVAQKAIGWMGLPRRVLLPALRDNKWEAYRIADNANRQDRGHEQDEYFEWYVHKSDDAITKVTFITELHDYYEQMWKFDRQKVVELYKCFVDDSVKEDDLKDANGNYDILNRWNTTDGIMHYTQSINTLGDAIGLAENMRMVPTDAANNYQATPAYGKQTTSVDPRVDYDVHMLLRNNLYVSLQEPIGIYILGWDNSGLTLPDGSPAPIEWWQPKRSCNGKVVRLEYSVPEALGFHVSDLAIGGHKIQYGAQLVEHITVGIIGSAGTKKEQEN